VSNIRNAALAIQKEIRSLRSSLLHIISDERIVEGATLYFKDILDNLDIIGESVKVLETNCNELRDEYDKMLTTSRDRTIYTLTVVTTVFLPAQFLAGVYGMNFAYMPELSWKPSYYIFWAVCFLFFLSALVFFRCG